MLRGIVLLTLVGVIGLGCSAGGGEACTSCHSELGGGGLQATVATSTPGLEPAVAHRRA